jgi:hypothetical protein
MGLLFYPAFDVEIDPDSLPGLEADILGHVTDWLHAVAQVKQLVSLRAFMDSRTVPPSNRGYPEDVDSVLGPCKEWYGAEAGIKAVQDLIREVKRESRLPEKVQRIGRENIVKELENVVRQLEFAKRRGARFRFELR